MRNADDGHEQGDDIGTGETVETTRTQGLKFLESLKQAKDKT